MWEEENNIQPVRCLVLSLLWMRLMRQRHVSASSCAVCCGSTLAPAAPQNSPDTVGQHNRPLVLREPKLRSDLHSEREHYLCTANLKLIRKWLLTLPRLNSVFFLLSNTIKSKQRSIWRFWEHLQAALDFTSHTPDEVETAQATSNRTSISKRS